MKQPCWSEDDRLLGMALAWGEILGGEAFSALLASGELEELWGQGLLFWNQRWPKLGKRLEKQHSTQPEALGAAARRPGMRWVGHGEPDYPAAWLALGARAPAVMQVQGAWPPPEALVAVVGTRGATPTGLRVAEQMGRDLARAGVAVASGLAAGIDGAAHRGALAGGGPTWALVGFGLDHRYPTAHVGLADGIVAAGGGLVSPWAPQVAAQPWRFLARNELLAALCLGTVVVEAPLRSGAMNTATVASHLGREVMAVPGCVAWPNSAGCHQLLREGAALVEHAADVLAVLGLGPGPSALGQGLGKPGAAKPGPEAREEAAVLAALQGGANGLDEVLDLAQLPLSQALMALGRLESRGLVRRGLMGYEALA